MEIHGNFQLVMYTLNKNCFHMKLLIHNMFTQFQLQLILVDFFHMSSK